MAAWELGSAIITGATTADDANVYLSNGCSACDGFASVNAGHSLTILSCDHALLLSACGLSCPLNVAGPGR